MTSKNTRTPEGAQGVTIEPLVPDHFDTVVEWLKPAEIHRYLVSTWRGGKITSRLLAMAVRNKTNSLHLMRQAGEPCGLVGLSDIDREDACGMVWILVGRRDLGGRGIATTGIDLICRYGFEELGLRCIYAWIMAPNIASIRIVQKNGFRELGRMRQATTFEGQPVDRVYFDKVASEL